MQPLSVLPNVSYLTDSEISKQIKDLQCEVEILRKEYELKRQEIMERVIQLTKEEAERNQHNGMYEYHIQERQADGSWDTIEFTSVKQAAEREVDFLKNKNGNYYRYIEVKLHGKD